MDILLFPLWYLHTNLIKNYVNIKVVPLGRHEKQYSEYIYFVINPFTIDVAFEDFY